MHLPDGTPFLWDPDEYGYMVVRRDPHRNVSVCVMLVNYRIVTDNGDPFSITGSWCYFGKDSATLGRALHAALHFAPEHEHPHGYDKYLFG